MRKYVRVSIGDVFKSNAGYSAKVIEKDTENRYLVEFEDGTVSSIYQSNMKAGKFLNYNVPVVFGVGWQGYGEYSCKENKEAYGRWCRVLERCYSESKQSKCPSYVGCSVSKEWLNFQNFATDVENMHGFEFGWQIDKDILFKNNKIYSRETCVFVPEKINKIFVSRKSLRGDWPVGVTKAGTRFRASLNNMFIGTYESPEEAFNVYKIHKESHIKHMAQKWEHLLSVEAFNGLMNYKIEITD